ncbi:MICAL-like protein 1 isoform X2 [Brachyhypopomus gauderio]|uniref:MICAL-like protein 1 isoform X2 n=1 Tax=Brachyhypopomus gauderio TaxID=698409 RepID=UPI004042420F
MGSLKALQEWCRRQCENYSAVEINNMSASFRDGLAFCAIIHRHRPDLIDFDSLSKENVYENNRLAFELAEKELGIPALLDAEDMVSMKVPDRLSVITYVSQYYNYFTSKSHVNPPCMKRPAGAGQREPAVKRPATPLEDRTNDAEPSEDSQSKRSTLSSTCAACGKHVHLVQRFLVDGKLYHRNCFRCMECSSTLLPGSYKLVGDSGSLVCVRHFPRTSSTSQNGRPDLSKQLDPVASCSVPETPPSGRSLEKAQPGHADTDTLISPLGNETNSLEREKEEGEKGRVRKAEEIEDALKEETGPRPASPPNPFDESDEEEEVELKEEPPKPDPAAANNVPPPSSSARADSRPVPAPRRVFDSSPPVRPIPRTRPPKPTQTPAVNGDEGNHRLPALVPRERSHSPAPGQPSDTPKPKDPPWLALVKQEPKKKVAPPPPPASLGVATPPHGDSSPLVKEEESRPASPPNPFDDEDDESVAEALVPPSVVAVHPWYGITQAADVSGSDTPPRKGSPAPSGSPGSGSSKKRPAPKAPKSAPTALSTESLSSSSSDHAPTRPAAARPRPPSASEQGHTVTKSVSEPSISSPGSSPSPPSAELQSRLSPSSAPQPPHTNTCSAPATPETNRSAGHRAMRPPPPRPPAGPSPLIGTTSSNTPNKRICKENPFNRKASPTVTSPQSRTSRGPRPARPPAPGHGFPLIKRKVHTDQYIPIEDIYVEMGLLERQLDELEHRGVDLEHRLRECSNEEEEERLLVDWFTLIHEKHLLVRREAELVYTVKQQDLEERQADVEYELRCLLNKPEREWSDEDRDREKQLMDELVTVIEQRNQIINSMDQDKQREEEEDKLVAAMLKKEFHSEGEQKKKAAKFKPMKVLKRLSTKGEVAKGGSPRKEKS